MNINLFKRDKQHSNQNEEVTHEPENSSPNRFVLDHIRILSETYRIMYYTDNPETLCTRYNFGIQTLERLKKLQTVNNDSTDISIHESNFSDDNFRKLVVHCYTLYMQRAKTELKSERGIENRKNKFWEVTKSNLTNEQYSELLRNLH